MDLRVHLSCCLGQSRSNFCTGSQMVAILYAHQPAQQLRGA